MQSKNNSHNKKIDTSTQASSNEPEHTYLSYNEHYLNIIRNTSDKIFNWAFTLNAGGFLATVTFMGAAIKWCSTREHEHIFKWLFLIFGSGIFLIIFALFLDYNHFCKAPEVLEKH